MEKQLENKRQMQARMPKFTRSDTPGKARIGRSSWRKPKGLHNKMGDKKKGHKRMPNEGYRTPKALRHMDRNGLLLVRVCTIKELATLDVKKHIVIIAAGVGKKNKITLLEACAEKGLQVKQAKDPKAHAEKIKKGLEDQRKVAAQKAQDRKKKRQGKKAPKKVEEKETTTPEDAKETKKELDKILTQKGAQ
jgi:large subunit ribosomal protein L32e